MNNSNSLSIVTDYNYFYYLTKLSNNITRKSLLPNTALTCRVCSRFGFTLHSYYGAPCSGTNLGHVRTLVFVGGGAEGKSIYKSIYMQRATHVRLISIGGCHLLVEKQIKVDH